MDQTQTTTDDGRKNTMLFAQLIEILTQNAVMMLGGMPDRQGRTRPPDLNAAEMMIDMLAVLQKKTKGNLTKEEERMISGTLYQLQTAFADVASKSGDFEKARKATESMDATDEDQALDDGMDESLDSPSHQNAAPSSANQGQPAHTAAPRPPAPHAEAHEHAERENKVKFTKKYG